MFKAFLEKHSLSEYDFGSKLFPDISDREYWVNFKVDGLIEAAESYLGYSWPTITASSFMAFKKYGDRKCMENLHFARRTALSSLVFGELCENKGRFIEDIVNGLFAICEETFWGLSAHWYKEIGNIPHPESPYIDLFAAETAEHVAMTYHLLKAPLSEYCPEIIDRIEYELERRIKKPYLECRDFYWMGYIDTGRPPNNWNPWILSNILSVYLLTECDKTRLASAIEKMFVEIDFYFCGLPADGGCDEGPSYWGRAGASLFEFIYELKQATGGKLDIFDNEKLRGVPSYMKKVHIKNADFICVADCTVAPKTNLGPFIYAFGKETNQADVVSLGKEVTFAEGDACKRNFALNGEGYRRRIYVHNWISEMEKSKAESLKHDPVELMEALQIAVHREGDFCLVAKGGHNRESHNHNDVGSFSLYFDGEAVLCDVGIGTYTKQTFSDRRYEIPWTRSLTHNVPEINGVEQRNGEEFAADSFEAKEGCVKVSFAGAYPEEAGVSALTREYKLEADSLTFTDKFDFITDKKQVVETLVTCLDVKIEGNSVILGDKYLITAEGGTPSTEFISFEGDPKLIKPWGREGVTRIAIAFDDQEEINVKISRI